MQSVNNAAIDIDALITKWKAKPGNLIMILHAIQNHYGYVPRDISLNLSAAQASPRG
jgi:NADH-quinone oxidoreductase subunit E